MVHRNICYAILSIMALNAQKHRGYIHSIDLDDGAVVRRAPEVENERQIAIMDLLEGNKFIYNNEQGDMIPGPYHVVLAIQEDNRLALHIRPHAEEERYRFVIPLSPFKRMIRDYFMICEEYFNAVQHESAQRLQSLDMGRRAAHNEGSEQLLTLMQPRIETDLETARRLFTLMCVLHIK